jgi:hypothetical protein
MTRAIPTRCGDVLILATKDSNFRIHAVGPIANDRDEDLFIGMHVNIERNGEQRRLKHLESECQFSTWKVDRTEPDAQHRYNTAYRPAAEPLPYMEEQLSRARTCRSPRSTSS